MVTITVAALLCAAVILVLRSALSVAHVIILPAVPLALGCWLLVGESRSQAATAAWFTASLAVIGIGYLVARRFAYAAPSAGPAASRGRAGPKLRLGEDGGRRYVLILVSFAAFFTLLHFAADGIPVLSHNVETRRFEFGRSLFGLPGRMYLFGMPLATGAALARARQLGVRWHRDRVTVAAISIFTVSRLLSGFKGGLLEVLIVLMIAVALVQGPVTSVANILRRYLPLGIAAVIGVFLVGSLYSSYRAQRRSLPEAILARATTSAALPGVLVFERRLLANPSSSIGVDTRYFAKKYFSVGAGYPYAFGRLVASTIFHVGPESGAYTAPVTYGAFPELAYDFGLAPALIAMFGLGALLALLQRIAQRATLGGYVICLASALAVYDFVNKGGLIYMCINWAIMTGMLLVAARIGMVLTSNRRSRAVNRPFTYPRSVAERIRQPSL
jgi:hypothetical protein